VSCAPRRLGDSFIGPAKQFQPFAMPYSDNMYSMEWDDDDQQEPIEEPAVADSTDAQDDPQALSPSDGYFRSASNGGSASPWPTATGTYGLTTAPQSSQVPHVPDVWVQDPSLQQQQSNAAESKAREAAEERRSSSIAQDSTARGRDRSPPAVVNPISTTSSSYSHPHSTPSHHHSTPSRGRASPQRYAPASAQSRDSRSASIYTESSSFFPSEAPPAYTPSPTSPPSSAGGYGDRSTSYRTFGTPGSSVIMGGQREAEEARGLLANEPQSMGGPTDDEDVSLVWRERVRRRYPYFNGRNCRVVALGLVLLLLTLGFLISAVSHPNAKVCCHGFIILSSLIFFFFLSLPLRI
jgi:hypothetical protein